MKELSFRIILVPTHELNSQEKDQLLSRIKSNIVMCGLRSVFLCYSQTEKDENNYYPEIKEFALEIRGEMNHSSNTSKIQLYEEFCSKWFNYCYGFPPSYIELNSSDSFVKSKKSHHELTYENISFGVLPHIFKFYRFALLTNGLRQSVCFYHDTRNVVIKYKNPFEFEITFSYQNIKNIFINIETVRSQIYFDLFNPPIIFRNAFNILYPDFKVRRRAFLPEIHPDVLGRANILCITFENSDIIPEIVSCIRNKCGEKPVYYSYISDVEKSKPIDPVIENIDFACTYLITALFKRNFTLISQSSDVYNSLKKLSDLSKQNSDSLEKALNSVLFAADSGKILNFWSTIQNQYNYYESVKDEINFKDYIIPSKCTMIRRIILTPTRQLLWPKEIMMSNRVLRNFDAEYSVRVSFREDNLSKLSFNALHADREVMDLCIKNPMINGIHIGTREYEFLAWSNSQIRDHGVWMYAKDEKNQTAAMIREWMGDFSHIHSVPKYMARMGQCFSQTEETVSVPLDPNLVRIEEDIERGYDIANGKPYCFSDGIGKISVELASQVHKALGHDRLCSAFQIRYGGCKGMLVIDPTLKDSQIVFRKSMKKFNCTSSTRLEIARTSAPVPLYLNRPFITLLNGFGVRHRTFLKLQESMLKTLTEMLYEESVAAQFLQSNTSTSLYNFKDLSKAGIYLTTEPFFKSLLLALHRHRIEKIKLRASLAIDPSKGRNMLGVIDETNNLNYGEVFVQYTRDLSQGETTNDTIIRKGVVLVTKNPCMYPGDVRKFIAVDIPSLHHIVDCIVFPQRGHRPHPNEMAGSDLDGDEYVVLWDVDLIFHRFNCPAGDFPSTESPNVPRISVSDMINFLHDYIKYDQVGAIANAHLAFADKKGIFSDECLKMAEKFFIAIDFPKTGVSGNEERIKRPSEYPDFMENINKKMYRSDKALGKIYRVCKDFESENQVTSFRYENIKVDPDLVYNGWERYQTDALNARNKYNVLFRSVLQNYGIDHEAEALSGAFTNLHCRFHERRDRNEIEKVIIACIKKLNKSMTEEFMKEFSVSGNVDTIENAMLQKASAWYIVTYSDPNAKFLSFPWCVSKFLVNIKIRRTLANPSPFSPSIMNLDQKIQEYKSSGLLPALNICTLLKRYNIVCGISVLLDALSMLMLWAEEEEIVARPGRTQGLLYPDVFQKLFFYVSEELGYITELSSNIKSTKQQYSAGQLCLEFLKYCSKFRFYNQYEMADLLPFKLYKYSRLAKCAIVSYHKFALSGELQILNLEEELITMKNPMYIDSDIFSPISIASSDIQRLKEVLVEYSHVTDLSLREILQKKKICVTATGSEKSLRQLKYILRKKDRLRKLLHEEITLDIFNNILI